MKRRLTLACLVLAAGFAAAPVSAQYNYNPGPGYYQPVQSQIYLPPDKARRNLEKLSRKQAEFYQRYGYPQPQPRYRQRPQYQYQYQQPQFQQPYGYAQPRIYAPQRQYRRPPPQYYYED